MISPQPYQSLILPRHTLSHPAKPCSIEEQKQWNQNDYNTHCQTFLLGIKETVETTYEITKNIISYK